LTTEEANPADSSLLESTVQLTYHSQSRRLVALGATLFVAWLITTFAQSAHEIADPHHPGDPDCEVCLVLDCGYAAAPLVVATIARPVVFSILRGSLTGQLALYRHYHLPPSRAPPKRRHG
jgi:hypothetical protein